MKTQDAIDFFGSHKAVADALGIWPQAVYRWGENVPPLRAYQLGEIMEAKRMEDELWDDLKRHSVAEYESDKLMNEWADEMQSEAALGELVSLAEAAFLYDVDETEFERRCAANEEENRMMDY